MTEARISLNLRPDDPDTHVVLGMALMTKGQVDEAAVHFSKAVEIRPNHSTATIIWPSRYWRSTKQARQ
jgi:Flp pilus assembly protein TadD